MCEDTVLNYTIGQRQVSKRSNVCDHYFSPQIFYIY